MKGLFSIALQITRYFEKNIFGRLEKKVGKKNADRVKITWESVQTYIKDGVEGLWTLAQDKIDELHKTVIQQIMDWVKMKVIEKAFTKLAVLFIPFAGLIAAAKSFGILLNSLRKNLKSSKLASSS